MIANHQRPIYRIVKVHNPVECFSIEIHKATILLTGMEGEDDQYPSITFREHGDDTNTCYIFNDHAGWRVFSAMAKRDSINVVLEKIETSFDKTII